MDGKEEGRAREERRDKRSKRGSGTEGLEVEERERERVARRVVDAQPIALAGQPVWHSSAIAFGLVSDYSTLRDRHGVGSDQEPCAKQSKAETVGLVVILNFGALVVGWARGACFRAELTDNSSGVGRR